MAYLHIRADRHAGLELPSGKLAAKTRLSEVRNELARLKIDGITAASGKAELLDAFSAAIHEAAKSLWPASKPGSPLGQMEIRRAVEHIGKQASLNLAGQPVTTNHER
jgi:hypothetical protein